MGSPRRPRDDGLRRIVRPAHGPIVVGGRPQDVGIRRRRPRRGSSMTRDVRRITSTERSAGARRRDDAGTGGRHRRNVTPDGHRRRPRRPRRAVLSRLPARRLGPGRGKRDRPVRRDRPRERAIGIRSMNDWARRADLPVVDEVMWEASDDSPGHCHHYPSLEQVRAWLGDAGFALADELASRGRTASTRTAPRARAGVVTYECRGGLPRLLA